MSVIYQLQYILMLLQNNPFVPYWFQGIVGNISQGYFHLQQVVLLQLHFLLSSFDVTT